MDEPQAEQLVETLDHCGAPRAAGGGLMCCTVATLASKARLRKQLHDAKTVLKSRYSSALAVSFSAVCS